MQEQNQLKQRANVKQIHVSLAETLQRDTKASLALDSNNKSRSIHKGKDLISWRKNRMGQTIPRPPKPRDYSTFGGAEEQCGL